VENETQYENYGYGSIYSCLNFSIVNKSTNKYIAISFFDNWKYHFMRHLGWDPKNLIQFFYNGGFNYIDYYNFKIQEKNNNDIDCPSDIKNIYHPFFYGPYHTNYDAIKKNIFEAHDIKKTLPQLYFRGYMWDFRQRLVSKISDESILIIDKNKNNNSLDYTDYLKDLSKYRCCLSLPGGTEVCNRDIECFGVGVPVMRPYLDINYPDPLISNYHYINFYEDCKYWDGNPENFNPIEFNKRLIYYWNIIKDNYEYLKFVSDNARDWYTKNCTLESNTQYILDNLNLEGLNNG
jgi:hypothetical protein